MDKYFGLKLNSGYREFRFSDQNGLDHIANLINASELALYEAPLPKVIAALAQHVGGAFYDVGANTGLYSLLAAAFNPQVSVIAFEPLDHIRERFSYNLSLNPHLARRIGVRPEALSNRKGAFKFYETINDQGLLSTSSSLENPAGRTPGEYRETQIFTTTLSDWQKEMEAQRPSFLKIDVEGHERAMLEGGMALFEEVRPFIIVELLAGADFDFVRQMMSRLDLVDFALFPDRMEALDIPVFLQESWNHLLCPRERIGELRKILAAELEGFSAGTIAIAT